MTAETPCPCGSGRSITHCCGPFITGTEQPPTAEALMRSRYTAYTLGRADYLHQTWHPSTRKTELDLGDAVAWLGLKVLRVEGGGETDDQGLVEFVARYKIAGRGHRLHEISRFRRYDERWTYLDGEAGPTAR